MNEQGIKNKISHRKNNTDNYFIILSLILCVMLFILTLKQFGIIFRKAEIKISADNIEYTQGEDTNYQLTSTVSIKKERDKNIVLDKSTSYTVENLIEDLQKEDVISLSTEPDLDIEGEYQIQVSLNSSFMEKIKGTWKKKVTITFSNGTFLVKNAIGEWDGNKFKRYDGSYVTDDFVVSKGNTYYFDDDGEFVTGRQSIDSQTYFFDDKGVMKTGWEKTDEGQYYLADNGAAVTGWYTVDDADYFFDSSGLMVTGEMQIGLAQYEFDDDGKVISKEEKIDPSKPSVALTFDDGPGERTGELLEQLKKYCAHATFFMLGKNVLTYKDDVEKMKEIGCETANHSYDHPELSKLSASAISEQVSSTNKNIKSVTGDAAQILRPPYGSINDTVKKTVGMPMILWSIDTLDWQTRNAQTTIETVMNSVEDGDIILMHDIHSESIDAALELIPMLEDAGYQLLTVSELAELKGVSLKNGTAYAEFK